MVREVLLGVGLAIALLASGCSSDKRESVANSASSNQILKKDCSNPQWRKQNLGLWYSVCRQPMRW